MTISYPLALPTTKRPAGISFVARSVTAVAESPFTLEAQIHAFDGRRWEAAVTYPPLIRAEAEVLIAFLLALDGRKGTFTMGDPAATAPRGSFAGTPVVDGGGQSGLTLALKDFDPSATGVVALGDCLQLGSGSTARLHKAAGLSDFDADGVGLATIDIWPALRTPRPPPAPR